MFILYQAGVRVYYLLILFASLFSRRARLWISGRRENAGILSGYQPDQTRQTIWMHVSSLGEFEQGRPVLEKWKEANPGHRILLSFFSPSGFTIRKNYPLADLVFYLPADTRKNMDKLLDLIKPDIFLLVKYDFWPNLLESLHRESIPTVLISARFRREQYLFKAWGSFFLNQLRNFSLIFVQDKASLDLLGEHGFNHVILAGDTRIDAVIMDDGRRSTGIPHPTIPLPPSATPNRILIAGSTWPAEEAILAKFWNSVEYQDLTGEWRLIIAPHDIGERHLRGIENLFGAGVIRYSRWMENQDKDWKILLVDSIGLLKDLYRVGDVAFIGGGFGKGIHNVLEPSAAGLPVVFGPNYRKFGEAVDLVEAGAAFAVKDYAGFTRKMEILLSDPKIRIESGALGLRYLQKQKGATLLIIKQLMKIPPAAQ